MTAPRVCVAADADPAVNHFITTVLRRAGYEVRRLAGPWQVSGASLAGVSLVLLGGRGYTVTPASVARGLREGGNRTPIVILLNSADADALTLTWDDSTVRLLQKPFPTAELLTVAADLLMAPV